MIHLARQPNLLTATVAAYRRLHPDITITQIIRDLNGDLGTRYQPQRWYDWARRSRRIPEPVQAWMLDFALGEALCAATGAPVANDDMVRIMLPYLLPPS